MLNCNTCLTNNQGDDTIYVALHRTALAIAEKLKAQRLLDTTRRPNPDHVALYYDNTRNLVAAALRWNTPSGKIVRPVCRVGADTKFECKAPSTWPLYNLPGLLDAEPSKSVIVVEGEPCADAGNMLTTLAGSMLTQLPSWRLRRELSWSRY
jgi:hypothetical protein